MRKFYLAEMAKGNLFSLIIIQVCIHLWVNVPSSSGQRRLTTRASISSTTSYGEVWSTPTSRSSTVRFTPSDDDNVNFIPTISNNEVSGRPIPSTRKPLPDFNGGHHRISSTTSYPWIVNPTTPTHPTNDWYHSRATTRQPIVSAINDRFIDHSVPSVNFTASDAKNNVFNVKWNASKSNEGTLSIRNLRELKLTFICNATYPIEWLSLNMLRGTDTWEVDELRYFQRSHATATSWQTSPPPMFTTTTIYTSILNIKFLKSEGVPHYMELNCARARRDSPRGSTRKQTVIEISKDANITLHVLVTRDVQTWPKDFVEGSSPNLQYRGRLGANEGCLVDLLWSQDRARFECRSEQPSNLTIDYDDDNCYDYATCERRYSEDACWNEGLWNDPKLIWKNPVDMWTEASLPSAGIVFCRRDEDGDDQTDALQFFYSLPPICPDDNPDTRNYLHIASPIPLRPSILARDFISFCWTQRTYDDNLKDDISPMVIYAGQNVTVTCVASLYHFAAGTRIGIINHDQELIEYARITDAFQTKLKSQGCFNFTAKVHIKSIDVAGLMCENYLKQSSQNVQKYIPLIVRLPRNITFVGGIKQLASWNYTGQHGFQLRCEADGEPKPEITWLKQGRPLPESIEVIHIEQSASILKFPTLKDSEHQFSLTELHGTYTCEASNGLDKSSKTFHVESSNSSDIPVIIDPSTPLIDSSNGGSLWFLWVLFPVLGAIVFAIIGFLVWKIKRQSKELRLMSKAEVDEFIFGKPEFLQHHSSSEEVNNYAPFLPYNRDYEISKDQLEIDENAVLGSGAYAIVLRGQLTRKCGEKLRVAIKTARAMDDISLFKALLSELKIMGFIGTHPNIVNLLGAHTKNIQNREIFIAIEYCENGNLLTYLRDHRNRIKNLVDQTGEYDFIHGGLDAVCRTSFIGADSGLSTVTLIKWTYEIATGMEFLSHKKVIHGDLAARNILVNIHLIAKIGDFGLSRQLFEYANYIKKQQSPLPWKWLAVECLQDMRFSVKSDVWAYAILLFEIFSLGQVPYPGHSYNDEFLEGLTKGKRPNRPSHATKAIYTFMETCWSDKPEDRPNFTQVREFFNKLLSTLVPQEYLDLHEKVSSAVPNSVNGDIETGSSQNASLSPTSNQQSGSSGDDGPQSRFSFNINTKTITAVFHRS